MVKHLTSPPIRGVGALSHNYGNRYNGGLRMRLEFVYYYNLLICCYGDANFYDNCDNPCIDLWLKLVGHHSVIKLASHMDDLIIQ